MIYKNCAGTQPSKKCLYRKFRNIFYQDFQYFFFIFIVLYFLFYFCNIKLRIWKRQAAILKHQIYKFDFASYSIREIYFEIKKLKKHEVEMILNVQCLDVCYLGVLSFLIITKRKHRSAYVISKKLYNYLRFNNNLRYHFLHD